MLSLTLGPSCLLLPCSGFVVCVIHPASTTSPRTPLATSTLSKPCLLLLLVAALVLIYLFDCFDCPQVLLSPQHNVIFCLSVPCLPFSALRHVYLRRKREHNAWSCDPRERKKAISNIYRYTIREATLCHLLSQEITIDKRRHISDESDVSRWQSEWTVVKLLPTTGCYLISFS